jgi:hypothetical protein
MALWPRCCPLGTALPADPPSELRQVEVAPVLATIASQAPAHTIRGKFVGQQQWRVEPNAGTDSARRAPHLGPAQLRRCRRKQDKPAWLAALFEAGHKARSRFTDTPQWPLSQA